MEKINVAELLKDCPKGMELDCTVYNDVTFLRIDEVQNRCYFKAGPADTFWTTCEGRINGSSFGKCVIFPKGKTTWKGFIPPCKFKDGDVVFTTLGNIAIIRKPIGGELFCVYGIMVDNGFYKGETAKVVVARLATEEEKQKLFAAIKENGYKWNPETKTLEKLIVPNFKKGDKVRVKNGVSEPRIIDDVCDTFYTLVPIGKIDFTDQDHWELVTNKFDITTLVPFESQVLVRDNNKEKWKSNFWGFYDNDHAMNHPHECCGKTYRQCIPYEGNEHLLGTTNDCDEFYKTWE